MDSGELLAVILSLATLLGGVVIILAGLWYRARMRELGHQERLAMIERGMVPPPEFEPLDPTFVPAQRSRSLGIVVVGLGFALMFLIGVAGGAPESGVGIGGAVVIVGAAFIARSIFAPPPPPMREPPPPMAPRDPPPMDPRGAPPTAPREPPPEGRGAADERVPPEGRPPLMVPPERVPLRAPRSMVPPAEGDDSRMRVPPRP